MPESPDTDLSAESSSASDEARQQALRRLAQRMRGRADMPSLGDSIVAIQRIVNSDHSHMRSLTGGVLSDVSLTAKLLRMINTATYRSGIDGGITDVQRALALLGFRSIGMMAASMLLFERLPKGSGGARVRETFSHALLAALLAEEMCHSAQDLKNSYLAGMFMNLGEMLVSLHFPEEARAIDDFLRQDTPEAGALIGAQAHERRMQASRQVLGLSIQDLGSEVASQWGWPPELRGQLRRLYPTNTQPVGPGQDYLRVLATGASDLAVELHWLRATRDTDDSQRLRSACVERFAGGMGVALAVGGPPLQEAVERAIVQWAGLANTLGLEEVLRQQQARTKDLEQTAGAQLGLLAHTPARAAQAGAGQLATAAPAPEVAPLNRPVQGRAEPIGAAVPPPRRSALPPSAAGRSAATPPAAGRAAPAAPQPPVATPAQTQGQRPPARAVPGDSESGLEALSLALTRASERALSGMPIDDVVVRILEDLSDALELRNVTLCLREPSGRLRARQAIGPGAGDILRHFEVPLGASADLFSVLCAHGRVTLISDATKPAMAVRLPAWFKAHVASPCFVLMPMAVDGRVLGLLYGDVADRETLQLGERTLSMLGGLRNQLLLALRLRGVG